MIVSFVYPSLMGECYIYHRICYIALFLICIVRFTVVNHAMKDFNARYRVVYLMNTLTTLMVYAWVLAMGYININFRGVIDTTLFMTVSLIVPMCLYLNPLEYIVIAFLSNSAMLLMISQTSGIVRKEYQRC